MTLNFDSIQILNRSQQIYPVTNEVGQEETIGLLKTSPSTGGDTWVGVSCLFNFNGAAARKVKYIEVIDLGDQKIFWDPITSIIRETEDYKVAAGRVRDFIGEKAGVFFKDRKYFEKALVTFSDEIKNNVSWLSDRESYQWIRQIILGDRFKYTQVDLRNTDQVKAFRQSLDHAGRKIDSFYESSVLSWVDEASLLPYYVNLETLLGKDNPYLIHSEIGQPLKQHVEKCDSKTIPKRILKSIQMAMDTIESEKLRLGTVQADHQKIRFLLENQIPHDQWSTLLKKMDLCYRVGVYIDYSALQIQKGVEPTQFYNGLKALI